MEFKDDRTPEQHETHTELVVALDMFMSGWGSASNGKSYCAWACHPYHIEAVLEWVKKRGDLSNIRLAESNYKPRGNGHFHIYVIHNNHPALQPTNP